MRALGKNGEILTRCLYLIQDGLPFHSTSSLESNSICVFSQEIKCMNYRPCKPWERPGTPHLLKVEVMPVIFSLRPGYRAEDRYVTNTVIAIVVTSLFPERKESRHREKYYPMGIQRSSQAS